MPDPVTGLVVGGSSLLGAGIQSRSASKAASAQGAASQLGIDEQRRQFDAVRELLAPYVAAGGPALAGQQALLGLSGASAQRNAIGQLAAGPEFQAMLRQGENALLQNASATGGLRGGNLQAALGQFRPQMLSALIDQQYNRLGGLTSLGQNAAAGVGNAGMQTGQAMAGLLQQQGAAQAGKYLAQGQALGNLLQLPAQFVGLNMAQGGTGKIF